MEENLLRGEWTEFGSAELRLLLDDNFEGPGQYDSSSGKSNRLHLPSADSSCEIVLIFRDRRIAAIEPGPAFDAAKWQRISDEVSRTILSGQMKVGRYYSFSSCPVTGSWRGESCGVQILPPPGDAPQTKFGNAEHPFILEFPVKASASHRITNLRWMRDHRRLTHLLNVLLNGRTSLQPRRPNHFWALVHHDENVHKNRWLGKVRRLFSRAGRAKGTSGTDHEIRWVQQFYFATLGEVVIDELSPSTSDHLEEIESNAYYEIIGDDGKGLRVPSDLDESIHRYLTLPAKQQAKFDRAAFWIDMASRQWSISISASFASLVTAIESLTVRGEVHSIQCPKCGGDTQHEVPGATQRFKTFFDTYAPGTTLKKQRDDMYSLRSGILHGSRLMQLDQELAFGWDPPGWDERELQWELWSVTGIALRNWLKDPAPV